MKEKNLTIKKGTTFSLPVRWQDDTLTYKNITAITRSGPVRITAADHGCPDGWEAAVMNAGGMREINAEENPPGDSEWHIATNVDTNTVEFNTVNSAGFKAYTSGGQLVFYAPESLTVPALDSQAFTFTSAVYDLEIEDADGVVSTLLTGSVEVTEEVTTP